MKESFDSLVGIFESIRGQKQNLTFKLVPQTDGRWHRELRNVSACLFYPFLSSLRGVVACKQTGYYHIKYELEYNESLY